MGFASLPHWVVVGVGLGIGASLVVVAVFLLAIRYFPATQPSRRASSGESRRRREFRRYLAAIGESYAEDHPVAGQPVAFYLPERDVAITFDAKAYFRLLRSETEPVLAEHEMPGSALGARLPFETPDRGPGGQPDASDGRAAEPIRHAFAELGLPVGAPAAEVQRAYRQQVKHVHPDQGGDEDAFRRLREAYATAKQHAES